MIKKIVVRKKEQRKIQYNYSYQAALAAICWKVDDIIGGEKSSTSQNRSCTESMAQVKQLSFLTSEEQRTLNEIRRHEDLAMEGCTRDE
jgi:hypothetical protein